MVRNNDTALYECLLSLLGRSSVQCKKVGNGICTIFQAKGSNWLMEQVTAWGGPASVLLPVILQYFSTRKKVQGVLHQPSFPVF